MEDTGKLANFTAKLMGFFFIIAWVLAVFEAGFDAGKHNYAELVFFGIISIIFGLSLIYAYFDQIAEAQARAYLEQLKELESKTKPLIEKMKERTNEKTQEQELVEIARRITREVAQGVKPTTAQLATIQTRFHDETGSYIRFTKVGELNAEMDISSEPFTDTPEASEPAETGANLDGIKKLTTRQQRKAHEAKGHGAITDAEYRDQTNAKRRAARAAKKREANKE